VHADAIPASVFALSPDALIVDANECFLQYVGASLADVRAGLIPIHPDDIQSLQQALALGQQPADLVSVEFRLRRQDGAYRWQRGSARTASAPDPSRSVVVAFDFHDEKRARDALAASEARYRALIEAMPELVGVVDIVGRGHFRNRAFYEYTGLTDDQALDWWNQGLVLREDVLAVADEWQAKTSRGLPASAEVRVRRRDGEHRWHLVQAAPLDSLRHWVLIATDIHDRKIAEQALLDALAQRDHTAELHRSTEEQLMLLVEASSTLIESLELEEMIPRILGLSMRLIAADAYALWAADGDTHWRVLTSAGLSPEYLAEASVASATVMTPRDLELMAIEDVRASPLLAERIPAYDRESIVSLLVLPLVVGGVSAGTLTFYYRQRHTFSDSDLRVSTALANLTASAMQLARLNDNNERLYRDAARIADDLRKANSVKDEFLGMVSHELKTPITMILGGSDVLSRFDAQINPADRATALRDIHESARRLGQLVDNLLNLSRLEVGKLVDLEPVLIRYEVERVVAEYRTREPDRRFTMALETGATPVIAEPTIVRQVLENLISNAVKYSPPGAPIDVATQRHEHELILSVLDRGVGITEEESELVFEPFYRSERTSRVASGAGIGLTVCRRLIEAQGGHIWAAPRDGGGSVFSITLSVDLAVDAVDPDLGADDGEP
jgi:PAS domain S-box-containing protein